MASRCGASAPPLLYLEGIVMGYIGGLVTGIFILCCGRIINPTAYLATLGATIAGTFLGHWLFALLDDIRSNTEF